MKDYRFILIAFLIFILIVISILTGSRISSLNEQNNELSNNIGEITKKISSLELDKTMKQIADLRTENASLKKQIRDLKAELSRTSKKIPQSFSQEARKCVKEQIKEEKTVTGNQGFLIKESKPAH